MEQSPELYREYDLTDNHCRHFVRKEDGGDGICCGLIDCEVYHDQSIKSKTNKTNTEEKNVLLTNITINGVQFISLWNRLTKRHLTENNNNLISIIQAYTISYHIFEMNVV